MTQRCLEDRELNLARSKPDTVDRPIRTAHIFVHRYNSTQYCNTETVLITFLQTNITKFTDSIHSRSVTTQQRVQHFHPQTQNNQ